MKMKLTIVMSLLIFNTVAFAQQNKIVELLNQQFKKEQKMYEFEAIDQPKLIHPFEIKNDTLKVSTSYLADFQTGEIWHYNRAVHIKDIEGFIKDINVLFVAKDGSVKVIVIKKDEDGNIINTEENHTHLFFTELRKDTKDQKLQSKMLKAFEKAGYNITSEFWYN